MNIYIIKTKGLQDTVVFAESYDQAADIFVTQYMAVRDSAPGEFAVSRLRPSVTNRDHRLLNDLRGLGIPGVGQCDENGVWTIEPPEAG